MSTIEQKKKNAAYMRWWRKNNKNKIHEINQKSYKKRREDPIKWKQNLEYHRKYRKKTNYKYFKQWRSRQKEKLMNLLGGMKCNCSNNDCWHSGKCTVLDIRCLQFDHIYGGGNHELSKLGEFRFYKKYILNDKERVKIQVLCANCNWVKRVRNNENRRKR